MPYRPDGDFLQDDESRWDVEPEVTEGGAWWKWAVAVLSLALFVGVVWYAYSGGRSGPSGPVRTVEADPVPYKTKPENPGGEIIPDQDKLVFNEAVGRTMETEEFLGDGPEVPQSRPEPVAVRKFVPPPPRPSAPATAAAPAADQAPATAVQQAGQAASPDGETTAPAAKADGTSPAPVPVQQPDSSQAQAALPAATDAAPVVPQIVEAKPAGAKSPVVQLGAYGTEQGAMDSWAQVQRKQGSIVDGLIPQVIKFNAPGKGDLYRLVIGPFADRGAATDVCGQLKDQGRDCIVNAN
ncbi:SPOR domain-containing protein [Emcibacter sp. SYSU 3D8]|uniref:SPOR domain-containing protein n=1 Tax=Emcibacter sp. SYSU 3D8 TaxID=3133969 RepID=UPI0031FEBD0C